MSDRSLSVDSDLTFSVTGTRSPVTGSVTGSGSTLTVEATDPAALLAAVRRSVPPAGRRPAEAADALSSTGLTVQLVGPGGPFVTVGADADSAIGRLITGSRHVRLGSPRVVAPLLLHASASPRTQRFLATGLVAVAGGALLLTRLRRAR